MAPFHPYKVFSSFCSLPYTVIDCSKVLPRKTTSLSTFVSLVTSLKPWQRPWVAISRRAKKKPPLAERLLEQMSTLPSTDSCPASWWMVPLEVRARTFLNTKPSCSLVLVSVSLPLHREFPPPAHSQLLILRLQNSEIDLVSHEQL